MILRGADTVAILMEWIMARMVKVIRCSNLKGGGGELVSNKKFDLWLQLVCTKLKLIQTIEMCN